MVRVVRYQIMGAREIGTLEAKTHLSDLLAKVERGACYRIMRHGKAVAELRPVGVTRPARKAGFARGTFTYVAADFDAPLEDFAEYMK